MDKLIDELKTSGKTFKYLEWTKQKEQAGNEKGATYNSKKVALSSDCKEFAKKVKTEFEALYQHSERF